MKDGEYIRNIIINYNNFGPNLGLIYNTSLHIQRTAATRNSRYNEIYDRKLEKWLRNFYFLSTKVVVIQWFWIEL